MLHGTKNIGILQHEAAAAQFLLNVGFNFCRGSSPFLRNNNIPGGQIQHTRRHHRQAKVPLALLLQRKEIQQHLDAQTVLHIGEINSFLAGFIVYHTQIQLAVLDPAVHTVHLTHQTQRDVLPLHTHGGQIRVPPAKTQLKLHEAEV